MYDRSDCPLPLRSPVVTRPVSLHIPPFYQTSLREVNQRTKQTNNRSLPSHGKPLKSTRQTTKKNNESQTLESRNLNQSPAHSILVRHAGRFITSRLAGHYPTPAASSTIGTVSASRSVPPPDPHAASRSLLFELTLFLFEFQSSIMPGLIRPFVVLSPPPTSRSSLSPDAASFFSHPPLPRTGLVIPPYRASP
jgi:hypothetical protein